MKFIHSLKKKHLLIDLIRLNQKNNSKFVHIDPVNWINNENYRHAKYVIRSIKVVDEAADREVKLMEEYKTKFTKIRRSETVITKSML